MSHSSNIQIDGDLLNFFNKCKQSGNIRAFKVVIKDEKLVLDDSVEPQGTWKDDFIKFVKKLFMDKEPCYMLFRLDSKTHDNLFDWILISWSPDDSHVRQKMLYASTKAILKLNFKSSSIVDDFFATTQDELNSLMDNDRGRSVKTIDPDENLLTDKEQDLIKVKREEALVSVSAQQSIERNVAGIEFPITQEAVDGLLRFKENLIWFIELSIDLTKEMIQLESTEDKDKYDIKSLSSKMPTKNPRYILFAYPHCHDGVDHNSIFFVYYVPANGCPVKEKMLYSTCKLPLLAALQDKNKFGLEISKKLEVDDPSELKEESLFNELHPKEISPNSATKFAKPRGPPGKRGAKRLIKVGHDV